MIPYTCAYMCILHVCACVHTHTKLPLKFKENSGKLASIQQQILIWHWFVVYLFKIGSHVVWATLNRWWPLTPDPPGSTSKSWNKQPPPHLVLALGFYLLVFIFLTVSLCNSGWPWTQQKFVCLLRLKVCATLFGLALVINWETFGLRGKAFTLKD